MQHEEHTRTDDVETLEGRGTESPEIAPAHTNEPSAHEAEHHGPAGIIGIIILILIIALGGLYFWNAQPDGPATVIVEDGEQMPAEDIDPVTEELLLQGTTNDYESIQEDLEATDLGAIDQDLDELEAALEAELAADSYMEVETSTQ